MRAPVLEPTTPTADHARTRATIYLGVCAAAVATGAAVPNYLVAPMGRETHFMALIGPGNPHAPGTNLWLMAPMVVVYGMILTSLVAGWLPVRVGKVGVLLLGLVTASIAGYLTRWALVPFTVDGGWLGLVDIVAMLAYAAAAVPAVWAGSAIAARDEVLVGKVVAAGILLHAGMLPGMLAADLLGGPGGGGHEHLMAR
jgi:hypothetical protein